MTIRTVLFDVDGTLVDSTYLHVDAWQRALVEQGVTVDAWRVHRAIGKDSALLLESLAGDRDTAWTEAASERHDAHFRQQKHRLRAFEGSRELLRAIAARGVRVVLATSAPADELALLRAAIDADDAVHAVTSADDVDAAKPDPGILNIALDRADADPAEALVVGDSVWDMLAAARAGIKSIGVLCGGIGPDELRDAGASALYADPAALLTDLDRVL